MDSPDFRRPGPTRRRGDERRRFPAIALVALLALLLAACVNLPGSDASAPVRYRLQGPDQPCVPAQRSLALRVVQVAAGLDSDRIAQVRSDTGAFSYLGDRRWVSAAGTMVEQRLAADLECRGIAVQTGHRVPAGTSQLLCELRALNLVESPQGRTAEVALSCTYRASGDAPGRALLPSARVPLETWSAAAAMGAFNAAYRDVFDDLYAAVYRGADSPPAR